MGLRWPLEGPYDPIENCGLSSRLIHLLRSDISANFTGNSHVWLHYMTPEIGRRYVRMRQGNVSWSLLASRRAPLVLGCLKPLFEEGAHDLSWEDAAEKLAEIFAEHANYEEFCISSGDHVVTARQELRDWLKRGLVAEREGRLLATDALQKVFQFLASLEDQHMTSTASRLATVQREIENLEARLNPDRLKRATHLRKRISALEEELLQVERGKFEVLGGPRAQEGIREVYQLALSLRADFRRVEDSYREADRQLRQNIVRSDQNRGSVLDLMLDGHDALLQTPEGSVFDNFYQQLGEAVELEEMKGRLRSILESPDAIAALNQHQRADLRWLVPGLVRESERVIEARARGERDVRGFIKAGQVGEQHRVGALLNDILEAATDMDWSSFALRRSLGPLPPIGISTAMLPLVQRLRFKEAEGNVDGELDLTATEARIDDMTDDFWAALHGLDRLALHRETLAALETSEHGLTIGGLADSLPPTHDLETLAYWLSLARETETTFSDEREQFQIDDRDDIPTRFDVPLVRLDASEVAHVDPEILG